MTRRFPAGRIIIFLFVIIAAVCYPIITNRFPSPQSPAPAAAAEKEDSLLRVLLLPLDSRPPCSDYVVRDSRLAGIGVILPPKELMDYYTQPGQYMEMRKALLTIAAEKKPDAIIISADQLMAGGLLASRDKLITTEERQSAMDFLRRLHRDNPTIPIHVFSILPRLLPPPEITLYEERLAITKYARLEEKAELGEATTDEIAQLRKLQDFTDPDNYIKPQNLKRYQAIHPTHEKTAKALADLTREGTIAELFIGQDDGEKYGPGNRERRHLMENFGDSDRLHLVRGADELALSIITRLAVRHTGISPSVEVTYSVYRDGSEFFPYMAASLADTSAEEISLLGLTKHHNAASDEKAADITLFIHAGDKTPEAMSARRKAVPLLFGLISEADTNVALVDLSRSFTTEETLLPLLSRKGFPLHRLTSYSGWNTASNSIGTALCEAVLTHIGQQRCHQQSQRQQLAGLAKEILNAHFAEDSIYLKDSIDRINGEFYRRGFFNTGDLDLDRDYRWLTILNDYALKERSRRLMETAAWRKPYFIDGDAISPQRKKIQQYFPWPRTFEVNTKVN
ncbi:MAG: DUF4127 family protein [Selenomonadaceae bacterium]|nr:DUF4127 family protein [Selenomonadaceae bacterium]